MKNILKNLEQSTKYIRKHSKLKPTVAITLGSGLSSFAKQVKVDAAISYGKIPHFVPPTVDGHPGELLLGTIHKIPVAVLTGRIHYYEGHAMPQVVYPTRTLAHLGVKTFVLTNAAGGIDPQMKPGDLMILSDHINLTGDNPLRGPNAEQLGPRFPDMSHPYDPEYISLLSGLCQKHKLRHSIGVYCGVAGPSYETAAEVRFLQKIGGSAVGMSTVAETIAARHLGARVCAISCITNLATGLSNDVLNHKDVKKVAAQVEKSFSLLLVEFLKSFGH